MAKRKAKRAGGDGTPPKRRRGRGEGSIFQRADGLWSAAKDFGIKPNGKRDRRYVYGKTKRDVQEKLDKLKQERASGVSVDPQKVTVGEYLESWVNSPGRQWRPQTVEGYRRMISDYLAPRLGRAALQKLTTRDVEWFVEEMAKDEYAGGTQVYAYTVLRLALDEARQSGLIRSNPCDAVAKTKRPKAGEQSVDYLTEDEVRRLLTAAEGYRLYGFYYTMIYGGLRPGEMVGLRRQDYDTERRIISVRRTVGEVRRQFHVGEPKTKKSRRAVTMPAHAVEVYKRHLAALDAEGLGGCELAFPNDVGKFLHRSSIGVQLHKALKRAGLRRIRPHDLRHTHASLLLAKGVNPKVVSERLGHASVVITLNRYSHVIEGLQSQAADALDDPFATAADAPKQPKRTR